MTGKIRLLIFVWLAALTTEAQDMKSFRLYKPGENAEVELDKIIARAKTTGKHVFIQIGGNWCVWCARCNEFVTADTQIDSLISKNYIVYHMNYPDKINKELLERYEYLQRFGFPVFIILNGEGKRLHTQNSSYLEQDKGYSKERVYEFFVQWTPAALNPNQYKNF
jgi:thioredoxin-related protein